MNDILPGVASGVSWYIKEQEKVYQEKTPLQQREEKLAAVEAEAKTISEAEALIDKQNQKTGEQK